METLQGSHDMYITVMSDGAQIQAAKDSNTMPTGVKTCIPGCTCKGMCTSKNGVHCFHAHRHVHAAEHQLRPQSALQN